MIACVGVAKGRKEMGSLIHEELDALEVCQSKSQVLRPTQHCYMVPGFDSTHVLVGPGEELASFMTQAITWGLQSETLIGSWG